VNDDTLTASLVIEDLLLPDPEKLVFGPGGVFSREVPVYECGRCGEKVLPRIVGV